MSVDVLDEYDDYDPPYDLDAFRETYDWPKPTNYYNPAEVTVPRKKINVKSSSLKNKLAACDKRIATMQRAIDRLTSERSRIDIENAEWFGTRITKMNNSHLCNALRWAGRKFNTVQIRDHDYDQGYAILGPSQVYGVYDIMFDEAVKRGLRF